MCAMATAELDLLTAPASATPGPDPAGALATVQGVVAQFITELDGTRPEWVDPERSLTDYATNSVQMLQLHARLEDAFGVEIAASALFDHHTVAALADHLAADHLAGGR
jgi:acyl carrier protein